MLDAVLVCWLAMAIVLDPIIAIGPTEWSVVIELRALGAAAILAARLAFMRAGVSRTAGWWLLGATGAVVSVLTGLIGGPLGDAAPYQLTPILWWLVLTLVAAPRPSITIGLTIVWLAGYVVAVAVAELLHPGMGSPTMWRHLVTTSLLSTGALVLATRVSHRVWQLEHDLYESRRLGRYRLLSPIGRGGMNDVWLAWDEQRRREVALKLLHTPGAAALTKRRFEREAELVRKVRSSHTVRIHDYGVSDDGFAYIAFEYLRGMDLEELVQAYGALEPQRALHLMLQASRGLGSAHAARVLHRDVKPGNIHCSDANGEEDFVRVLDFGLGHALDDTPLPPAVDGTVMGTPAYMAPEVWGAESTAASDVYSLGATFYFALTGSPPIDADSPAGFRQAHRHAPVVPPSLRADVEIPRALEKIVLRCLAKDPQQRFADAGAVADALEAALRTFKPWTREDAARWWHRARVGRVPAAATANAEHTTDVEVVRGADGSDPDGGKRTGPGRRRRSSTRRARS